MDYAALGKSNFLSGYNCCQSVLLAFKDKLNLPEETLIDLGSSFGGGIGRLRQTCGCISAMSIIMGLLYGKYNKDDVEAKANHYRLIQTLSNKFKERFGSYNCATLLNLKEENFDPMPSVRNKTYYESRPCAMYIYFMCELIDKEIKSREQVNY